MGYPQFVDKLTASDVWGIPSLDGKEKFTGRRVVKNHQHPPTIIPDVLEMCSSTKGCRIAPFPLVFKPL